MLNSFKESRELLSELVEIISGLDTPPEVSFKLGTICGKLDSLQISQKDLFLLASSAALNNKPKKEIKPLDWGPPRHEA